ncbi:MAG: RNA-binding protein, partial [Candidatus Omnitrophica bacterium]|nr:RNA-binding protein [Candidatus Omnitrophota bacterium]
GNLEYSVAEDDLKKSFEEKGLHTKAIEIIKDKYTGRSKGFGFVEVESEEEIQKAIESLDGQDLKGRTLKVSKAKKPRERSDRERPFRYKPY